MLITPNQLFLVMKANKDNISEIVPDLISGSSK